MTTTEQTRTEDLWGVIDAHNSILHVAADIFAARKFVDENMPEKAKAYQKMFVVSIHASHRPRVGQRWSRRMEKPLR